MPHNTRALAKLISKNKRKRVAEFRRRFSRSIPARDQITGARAKGPDTRRA